MPRLKPHRSKDSGEVMTPLLLLDVIDNCLKDMRRTFPQKELTPEEIEHWHHDLSVYPQPAIEWAFDNWRRNGRFFPVYGDIIDQCIAWEPPEKKFHICNAECRSRHGKGYSETDILWLFNRYMSVKDSLTRPMTDNEIDNLLAELDAKRGESPEWRKRA